MDSAFLATHPALPLTTPAGAVEVLSKGPVIAISVSGGKDSHAAACAAMRYLDATSHAGPRVMVHADLGRIEWRESLPSCERIATHLGLDLLTVRRSRGDMVDRWAQRWADNLSRYQRLERLKVVLPWSTASMRFCTSELKTDPISQALTARYPGQVIVSVSGIRAEESRQRATQPAWAPNPKLTRKRLGTSGWMWSPIIDWSVGDVWAEIQRSGVPAHPGYTRWGMSRISCSFCIMSNLKDLTASVSNPEHLDVYRELVDLELASTFSFQAGRWLADLSPGLLRADQRGTLESLKEAARRREHADALVPPHLAMTGGMPTCMPTAEEADLLAHVRREVAAALGVEVGYTTGPAVRERYRELMAQRGAECA